MECVRRVFKDRTLLVLLERFVRMMPSGISIGLRSSQGLGNLFLSDNLDHHVKDKCGVPYYYRYCDDIVVLGKAKSELWKVRDIIHGRLSLAGLEVKPNERIFPVSEGIDFLGYVIRPGYTLLRKRGNRTLPGRCTASRASEGNVSWWPVSTAWPNTRTV